MSIKIKNSLGVYEEYNSITDAGVQTGIGGARNNKATLAHLAKLGYDIDSIEHSNGKKVASPATGRKSLIEKIIENAVKVDTFLVEVKTKEFNQLFSSKKFGDTVDDILKLKEEIEALKSPKPTLDTVLEYVTELFNDYEYHLAAAAAAAAAAAETEAEAEAEAE